MAENVVINIEANTSGLTETINLLTKLGVVEKSVAEEFQKTNAANVASIQKGVQSTTKEFEKLDKAVKGIKSDNGLAKSLDVSKEITKVGNSFQSLRSQLKEATIEAQNLAEQFGELDPRTLAAAKRAAQLKDSIGDVNAQIAALTPEGKFQAIQNLGGSIAGVFQVATGALQAFGVESEQATKIAQQFQGALNIFGGLSQLAQLKDSLTAAKAALTATTVATDGAKTAQLGLNAAVLSNPYVLAAAAIVAMGVALVAFSDDAEEAAAAAKALNDELNTTAAGYKGYIDSLDRSTKKRLSDIDTEIKLLELQGGKTKEIGDLKLQRIDVEKKGVQDLIAANQTLNNTQAATANQLIKSTEEETRKRGFALQKEIEDRTAANKDLQAQVYILNNERRQQEAETTAVIKGEQDKRVKDAQEAAKKLNEIEFEKSERDIVEKYGRIRLEEQKLYGSKEAFAFRSAELTQQELFAKRALYEQYGKSVIEIDQKILDNFQQNIELIPIDKFKQSLPTEDIQIIDADKARQDIEDVRKRLEELKEKKKELEETVIFEGVGATLDTLFANINANLEDQVKTAEDTKNAQLDIIKEEEDALLNSYEQRRIGKRQLEEEQKRLALERIGAEKRAERELAELKRKQDISTRVQALFDIAINTAKNVVSQPGLGGTLIPYWIALGAIQSAAVLAKPLPKYKKGTLSVGGVGSEDSQLALLQPGEAVIPTDTNRKYHPAIKAIYQNKIRPEDINAFVKMRLRGDVGERSMQPVSAKIETSDLYALGRIMKKNNGVHVTNMGDLAQVLASINNLRR